MSATPFCETEALSDGAGGATLGGQMSSAAPTDRRCPDGSWSKWFSRRCVLPFMHIGPHRYEIRVIRPRGGSR